MDPTTQAALAALIGVVVGAVGVLAWHISERQQRRLHPATTEPVVPPGVDTVLSVLRSSAVVVGEDDRVLKASAPAYSFGLVHEQRLVPDELADLVAQVRRDGQIRETELSLRRERSAPRSVSARVAPLGARLVLVLAEDRTRERRVEEVRRDFVANVSHELKTPVGAIHLLAEAVAEAADDPEAVQRFAGRMLVESDRLTQLVHQVIELSRLQSHDPVDDDAVVSLDEVLAQAVDTSATDAQARGIELVTDAEPGLSVPGDARQVGAAVSNLVANAVAYSDEGTSVVLSARARDDLVEISVIDRGIGIPPEELDRIFERFYRVDPARHRSTGGTGLGLSIVKHVAATHGGEVSVWSVEGQGSTFTLTLPRTTEAPPRAPAVPQPTAPQPSAPTGSRGPLPTERGVR
ncbi:sensor histidine kinase [Nocardioides solisilvae]|uniref:sensor histidine kinase n=1 Tax=Nocardioides solisilvae TaxID=1542435 RepID=UPI000D7417E0|nr:ATP-binding protein [Nocardioides solisilvae]